MSREQAQFSYQYLVVSCDVYLVVSCDVLCLVYYLIRDVMVREVRKCLYFELYKGGSKPQKVMNLIFFSISIDLIV